MKFFMGILLICFSNILIAENIAIGDLKNNGIRDWKEEQFEGRTAYTLERQDGKVVIRANSRGTASALVYKKKIDLKKTPWLNWRWKINNKLLVANEQSKEGDDYPARIYVIKDGGFWSFEALNYVWSSVQFAGTRWDNAFSSSAKMIAVQGLSDETNVWVDNKRNVLDDWKRAFGEGASEIDGIAIMTDTDNSQSRAKAWYGSIYFSSE